MPTETFAFIKEEPEARQIMKNFIFDNIKDLCERYVEQDIQVKKDLTINIPFNCNSFENQNNLTHIKKNDSKKNRSISDRNDTSNDYSVQVGDDVTEPFKMYFKTENLKMVAGDYNVFISSQGISHFKNDKENLEYWIALEPDSTYGS